MKALASATPPEKPRHYLCRVTNRTCCMDTNRTSPNFAPERILREPRDRSTETTEVLGIRITTCPNRSISLAFGRPEGSATVFSQRSRDLLSRVAKIPYPSSTLRKPTVPPGGMLPFLREEAKGVPPRKIFWTGQATKKRITPRTRTVRITGHRLRLRER